MAMSYSHALSSLLFCCILIPAVHHTPSTTYRSTDGVAGFGYNLETTSSPAADREASSDSVDPEDTWWVAAASGAGVGLAVVLLGAVLFTKYGKRKDHVGARSKPSAVQSGSGRGRKGGFPDETKAEPMSY